MTREMLKPALLLLMGFQVLYAASVFPVFSMVGDSADYASLIANAAFQMRTTHVGLYVAYYPFHLFNRGVFGLGDDLFLNLVTTVFGALTVPLVYLILGNILRGSGTARGRTALYGAVAYGLSGLVWYHAEFLETPPLMMMLAYLAFLLFLLGRYAAAGVSLALAALVSQAVAPLGGMFLAVSVFRRVSLSNLTRFAIAHVAVLVFGILPVYGDFIWGSRGLATVHDYYQTASLVKTLLSFALTMLESFWPVAILAVIGILRFSRQPELSWVTLASIVPLFYVGQKIGHRDYGVVWIPAMFFVAAWSAVGLSALTGRFPRRLRAAVALGVAVFFLAMTLGTYVLPKRNAWVEAHECLDRVHEYAKEEHLVTDPYTGFAYAHRFWPRLENVWSAPWSTLPADARALDEKTRDQTVFLLDYEPPSHFLRTALLTNPVSTALLSTESRAGYMQEFDSTMEELAILDPGREMDLVLSCNGSRLWRLSEPE